MKNYCRAIKKIAVFGISSMPDELRMSKGMTVLRQLFPEAEVVPWIAPGTSLRRLAGNDEERAARFNALVADESIDMLIAARGGFGATRILDKIDFHALKASKKLLMGYSDTCALLIAAAHAGCDGLIHGPMVCSSLAAIYNTPSLFPFYADNLKQLFEPTIDTPLLPRKTTVLKNGECNGRIFPCNLTMLESLIGTPYFSLDDLHGAILALEDIAVPAHAIDRSLRHFASCGILQNLSGMIYGAFEDCENNDELPEILAEYASYVPGAVLRCPSFGHCIPSIALPFNEQCVIPVNHLS